MKFDQNTEQKVVLLNVKMTFPEAVDALSDDNIDCIAAYHHSGKVVYLRDDILCVTDLKGDPVSVTKAEFMEREWMAVTRKATIDSNAAQPESIDTEIKS